MVRQGGLTIQNYPTLGYHGDVYNQMVISQVMRRMFRVYHPLVFCFPFMELKVQDQLVTPKFAWFVLHSLIKTHFYSG